MTITTWFNPNNSVINYIINNTHNLQQPLCACSNIFCFFLKEVCILYTPDGCSKFKRKKICIHYRWILRKVHAWTLQQSSYSFLYTKKLGYLKTKIKDLKERKSLTSLNTETKTDKLKLSLLGQIKNKDFLRTKKVLKCHTIMNNNK
jgi:hypothetical protein